MKLQILKGSTSVSVDLFIQDSSSTSGAGKTGLAYNTSGLTAYYHRPGAVPVAITLATQTVTGAFSSGGFVELDSTNMPGFYRLDIPNAALASGVNSVSLLLKGASGMVPVPLEIMLTAYDPQDAAALGLSRVDAAISSRSSHTAADVWASATRTLTAISDSAGVTTLLSRIGSALTITGGKVDVNDKTGFALSSAGVQAIWDALTSALTTVGSIGKRISDYLTGDAYARLGAPAGASVSADIAANTTSLSTLTGRLTSTRATNLDNLDATISSRLPASSYSAPPSAASIRSEIDANSTKLDVAVSTRLASASYTVPPTATENADALLKRDWTSVSGEAARSVLNALRALRNKVSRSGASLTVTKEDDSTSAWTASLTTDSAAAR